MRFVIQIEEPDVMKLNYHFSTIIISYSQVETQFSSPRSTNVNVYMYFPNSNFERNFSTYVFGKTFWHYRELNIECWTWRHILGEKIFKKFRLCGSENSCTKLKWIWRSHIPRAITEKIQFVNDILVFKYPVICKQKIFKFSFFYWN